MTPCPSDEQLSQLAFGRLKGGDLSSVEGHVDGCTSCRQLLAMISNGSAPPTQPERGVLQPGERLGRYEIVGLLAAGGMGMLYAANDTQLRRRVALKLMRPAFGGDVGRTRLLREAQAMAALTHPNVIGVYELGEVDGKVFVAMELVEGGTLREWMKTPRAWREVVGMFVAAGKGLSAAHEVGIIHRDFKPENVLVSRDGLPRIADFGLSRPEVVAMEEPPRNLPMKITHTGTLLGTPAYMSPEQLAGRAADPRSDQYAFCVCLYEALIGKRPFPADTLEELRARVVGGMPPPPKDGVVPAHVWAAIARGLHPNPAQRFPDMNALLTVLAFDGPARGAHGESKAVRIVGMIAAAVVVLATVGGGAALVSRERAQATAPIVALPVAPIAAAAPAPVQAAPRPVPQAAPEPSPTAAEVEQQVTEMLTLIVLDVGEHKELEVPGLTRVAIGNAARVRVTKNASGRLEVEGLSAGVTSIVVWMDKVRVEGTIEVTPATPPPVDPPASRLDMRVGTHRIMTIANIQRIAIGDTDISDVSTIGNNQIRVSAVGEGTTDLMVWTADGSRKTYRVHVKPAAPK